MRGACIALYMPSKKKVRRGTSLSSAARAKRIGRPGVRKRFFARVRWVVGSTTSELLEGYGLRESFSVSVTKSRV